MKIDKIKFILLMANMLLIAAFIFSCSSNDSGGWSGLSSSVGGDALSSSVEDGESSSSTHLSSEPLACDTVPASGHATLPITPPDLTCGNGENASNIRWLGVPLLNWNNPKDGTYSDINVMAKCGMATNLMVSCPGTLTVYPMVSCSMASTGYEGIAIKPELACSDGSVPFDTVFSGYLPNWDNPAVGSYAAFAEANCGYGILPTVLCGTLRVNDITLTCGSVPAYGYEGIEINLPALTCSYGTRGTLIWKDAPDWSNPAIGTYSNISVTATCGSVTREANCSGSLNVSCSGYSNTPTHYCSEGTMKEYGFINHGGQTYKTVVIGRQRWMAENLNYDPGSGNSVCYDNQESYCENYGRLYDWETAMTVCPSGWHLPSQAEWNTLSSYVKAASNCSNCDMSKLKATSGWVSYNSTDEYGFSAIAGGGSWWHSGDLFSFYNIGQTGYWWTANYNACEYENCGYARYMHHSDDIMGVQFYDKAFLFSDRCLLDSPVPSS